ncbi:hypothetical protein TNCV_207061 [Trichonephila clavipes]|nr:hypothetical protein TNCV_207061 [Trichonephila clavipes]
MCGPRDYNVSPKWPPRSFGLDNLALLQPPVSYTHEISGGLRRIEIRRAWRPSKRSVASNPPSRIRSMEVVTHRNRNNVLLHHRAGTHVRSIQYFLHNLESGIIYIRLSKQQDEDHERYAAQRYSTHVQSVTYPANMQAKEEAVPAANQDRI